MLCRRSSFHQIKEILNQLIGAAGSSVNDSQTTLIAAHDQIIVFMIRH